MTRINYFKIKVINSRDVYYPGQTILGQVVLGLQEPMEVKGLDIQCKGFGCVSWSTGMGDDKRDYSDAQTYIDVSQKLLQGQSSSSIQLATGDHTFPFSFTLPLGIPSSFEGGVGFVRYSLKAVLRKDWGKAKDKLAFTVECTGLDLNTIENATASMEVSDKYTLCCCCCASEPVTATVCVERTAYVPGENIIVDAQIYDGSRSGINKTQFTLLKKILFTAGGSHTATQEPLVTVQGGVIVPGGTASLRETLRVPYVPPSFSPGFACTLIKTEYLIELVVDVFGSFSTFKIPLEIIIGTIPARSQCPYTITCQPGRPQQYDADPPSYEECTSMKTDVNLPCYTPPNVPVCTTQPECTQPTVLPL